MTSGKIRNEISRVVREMEHHPEDRHELYLQLKQQLNELAAMGMPLPDDLIRFQSELEAEFAAKRRKRASKAPPARGAGRRT
jgi:RNA binding exosome subunit